MKAKDLFGTPTPSVEQIARKHGVSVEKINAQLKVGIKVELEHTHDATLANEIARDHLDEYPDYYARLTKAKL